MPIAITDDHLTLGSTAAAFLESHKARAANRDLLEEAAEGVAPFWDDLVRLGWLGLALPEAHGGSGYGLAELVVVVEELGRAVAPGPFVPTVIASTTIARAGDDDQRGRYLPGLADGSTIAGVGLADGPTLADGRLGGTTTVLGGGLAGVLVLAVGNDVVVVPADAEGVTVTVPPNIDPSRRTARVTFDGVAVAERDVLAGARPTLTAVARTLVAAEATGGARACTDAATAYAKEREQFGRPIAMFQAVKHHCANMLVASELATAATWDAARAADGGAGEADEAPAEPSSSSWRPPWPPRWRSRRSRPTPSSTSRCTGASASPGSTTPTCTCAGPPPMPPSSTPTRPRPPSPTSPAGASSAPPASTCRPRPRPCASRCGPRWPSCRRWTATPARPA